MLTSVFVFDNFQGNEGMCREDQEKDPGDISNLQIFVLAKCRTNLKSRLALVPYRDKNFNCLTFCITSQHCVSKIVCWVAIKFGQTRTALN